jgi:ribosomal protein L37E
MPSYKHEPCKNCGELFYFPDRVYCSDTCRAEGRAKSRRNTWTEKEIEILRSMVGVQPFPLVLEAVQNFNRANNMRVRTAIAIRSKAKRDIDCSLRPGGGYRTPSQLCRQLGVYNQRFTGWLDDSDPLPLASETPRQGQICLKDFEAWARRNRHKLAGIPLEKIASLVQDREFFRQSSAWPTARKTVRPVRNIDTGEVYPSVYVASKAHFVTPPAIYKSIRLARSAAGARWQYITGEDYAAAAMLGETAA